jgi:hypothetical protein
MGGLVTVLHNHIAHGFAWVSRIENEKKPPSGRLNCFPKKKQKGTNQAAVNGRANFEIANFEFIKFVKCGSRRYAPRVSIQRGLQEDGGEGVSGRPGRQGKGSDGYAPKLARLPV